MILRWEVFRVEEAILLSGRNLRKIKRNWELYEFTAHKTGGIQMKKYLKTMVLTICAVFAFLLSIGNWGNKVYAADVIVPTYVDANGSTANANTYQFQKEASAEVLSIPIQISNAGTVGLEVTVMTSEEQPLNVMLTKYADYKVISDFLDLSKAKNNETANISFYAKGSCTWYLHVFRSKQDSNPDIAVTVKAYQKGLPAGVIAGSGNLKNKTWSSFCVPFDEPEYYRIKVPSSGCLKFEIDCGGERIPTQHLLNSKKKEIGYLSTDQTTYYGVKKGTYYIKIENPDIDAKIYKMRYTFEKMKIAKHTKSSKAVVLKKGKAVKGLHVTGKYADHWYKLKLSKDQTVKINVSVKGREGILDLFMGPDSYKTFKSKNGKIKKTFKLKKGIYYFTMELEGGGSYSIQWK